MQLRNLKIGTQLMVGIGLILLLIVVLAVIALIGGNQLMKNMDGLYNHPYHVGRATRDINTRCESIHSYMKNIIFDEDMSREELNEIINNIDILEKETYASFETVYQRYLGSKDHIDSAYKAFTDWKLVRDKIIDLKKEGETNQMVLRYRTVNYPYVSRLRETIQIMVDFEGNKAASFFNTATSENHALITRLWVTLIIIILLLFLIGYQLFKSIRTPLAGLADAAEQYSKGNYEAEFRYESANEFGMLSCVFNRMVTSFRNELWLRESAAQMALELQKESELNTFCNVLLKSLIKYTGSQVAAIYFLNAKDGIYELYDSIGLSSGSVRSFSVEKPEGEFGALMVEKKIKVIKDIPDNTGFSFLAVTGSYVPREIVSIPVIENDTITAVISLASLHKYETGALQLLNDMLVMLSARITSTLASQKIRDYSVKVEHQNRELEHINRELHMQSDELKEYNIELEMQKKQLDTANQLKNSFLSNMSHELRTPLNSVIALSGVLNRKLKNKIPEEEYSYVEIIEKNGKHLLSLISDILDLSRIESGKEEIILSTFSIHSLVQLIIENLAPLSGQKNISVNNKTDVEIPMITSDRSKCSHILQNIIANAIKFTDKGSIEISAKTQGTSVLIKVKDTGIGIDKEHLPIIFDEFRQADERYSRKHGGTGLGLAIAKKYAIMLGGNILVESKPGAGSTFTVVLPQTIADTFSKQVSINPGENLEAHSVRTVGISGKSILIVEDSEPAIIQLNYILREEGVKVTVARNGKEALDIISANKPDAVILDLMMPEVDGFEVLTVMRNHEETAAIPVLILTAKHITKEELSALMKNNVSQLIQKGDIQKHELMAGIKGLFTPKKKVISKAVPKQVSGTNARNTVLIIEDNEDNMITAVALLKDHYNILKAGDGDTGIAMAGTERPDLILLDISLPEKDGFAVMDELQSLESLKNIPVIALTARAMKDDAENFKKYGFCGYISKPIDNDKFVMIIQNCLKNIFHD